MKKILSLLTLLLCVCSGAWAAPTVISLKGTTAAESKKVAQIGTQEAYFGRCGNAVALDPNGLTTSNSSIFVAFQITEKSNVTLTCYCTASANYNKDEYFSTISDWSNITNMLETEVNSTDAKKYFETTFSTFNITYNKDTQKNTPYSVDLGEKEAGYYAIYLKSSINSAFYIQEITLTPTAASTDPALSVDPSTAEAFSYIVGSGPSEAQAFTVSLSNSENAVSAAVTGDYEMCKTENGTYTSTAITDLADESVLYVRLKSGLSNGVHNGTLTFSNEDVDDDVVIDLSGSVTNPTYTVTYDLNGGTGTAAQDPVEEGASITLAAAPTKELYTFAGWLCSADAAIKSPGTSYTMTAANTTFTAQWTPLYSDGASYTFDSNATVGTSPSKTVSTTSTSYDAFRVDNLFFSSMTIQLENGASGAEDGNNFYGWKIKTSGATIKFMVEENQQVTVGTGTISGGANISYTALDGSTVSNSALVQGTNNTYAVKGGSIVTITSTSNSTFTLKKILVEDISYPVPTITAQPASGAIYEKDASAEALAVTASVTLGGLSHQWYSCDDAEKTNAAAIDGATSASYTPSTAVAGTYYYFCRVANSEDGTKTVDSDVVTVTVVADWGKSTWNFGSVVASDISANTTFWQVHASDANRYECQKAFAANERITLENGNGLDIANGIKFYRTTNVGVGALRMLIGRGVLMPSDASNPGHVEIPATTGKYYRITHARGSNGTFGFSVSSGAEYQSGDMTYSFTGSDAALRPSFIVKATGETIDLAFTANGVLTSVEQIEALIGSWSKASDEILVGTSAPAIPTVSVEASEGTSVPKDAEYTVTYSLKEGSTAGIVTVDANDGITAISNTTTGTATVIATIASATYGVATTTVEYTITVNARANTATTKVNSATGAVAVVYNDASIPVSAGCASLANVADVYDATDNKNGVTTSGTQTFTISAVDYKGLQLSSKRRIAIRPAEGVTFTEVIAYLRARDNTATTVYRHYKSDGKYDDSSDAVVASSSEDPSEINMTSYCQYGFAINAVTNAVFKITYNRTAKMNVTIKETGYATLYTDMEVAVPDGVTAYTGKVNGESFRLTEIEDKKIPANTGVILQTETPGTYTFNETTGATTVDKGELEGVVADTNVSDLSATKIYTLSLDSETWSKVGMREYTGSSLRAYSAYLDASDVAARTLTFDFGGEATAISGIEAQMFMKNNKFYNLNGQRVENPTKGLYIVNGKKVVIK